MAVLRNHRGIIDCELEVLKKSIKFRQYLTMIMSNNKVFPRRYRWAQSNQLIKNISDIQEKMNLIFYKFL